MGKQSKQSERAADEPRDVIRALAQQRSVEEKAAARAVAMEEKALAPIARTRECLFHVTKKTIDGNLVENHDRYCVATAAWARAVQDLAAAWKVFPKWDVTSHQRIPGTYRGFEVARHLWRAVSQGLEDAELAPLIDEAKAALGPVREGDSKQDHRDTELGIRLFFEELRKSFDAEVAATSVVAAGSRTRYPNPTPEAIRTAFAKVQRMARARQIDVDEVIQLYGLEGITSTAFTSTSRYLQRRTSDAKKAWQLPLVPRRAVSASKSAGRLRRSRWWSPEEVEKAIRGWAEKLGVQLK